VDLWLLDFSFVFGLILFFFEVFLSCFGVSVGFCWVLVFRKVKWD